MSSRRICMTTLVLLASTTVAASLSTPFENIQNSSLEGAGGYPTHHRLSTFPHEGKRPRPLNLCGTRLLYTLVGVCRGIFRTYNPKPLSENKASGGISEKVPSPQGTSTDPASSLNPLNALPTYLSGKSRKLSFLDDKLRYKNNADINRKRRRRETHPRNLIEECCLRSCTVTDMLKYCG